MGALICKVEAIHTAGIPGESCMTAAGGTSVVDSCGVCGGDGTSCLCLGGYLDFTKRDADAGVLCHVDNSLVSQIDTAINSLKIFQRQLALANCEISKELNFGQWLETMNTFCSGDACPTQTEPNLFSFLAANGEFSTELLKTLGQVQM